MRTKVNIGILGCAALLVFVSLAQAATVYDFESPTYTLGTMDGQDGWACGGSGTVPNPAIIAKPSAMPSSAGSQSAQIGWWTDRSTAGAGYGDLTSVSFLMQYTPTGSATEAAVYAGGLTTADVIARVRISGNNVLSLGTAPGSPLVTQFADVGSADLKVWNVEVLLDFAGLQYKSIWTDLSDSTAYDSGWATLLASRTAAQADANSLFSIGAVGGQGTGGQVFDNLGITVVPEPMTMSLLAVGGIGLLLRRRK